MNPNSVPELVTMPTGLYDLVTYAIVSAGFAFFGYFVYSWNSKSEVGVRYRPAVLIGLVIGGVALLSYVVLFIKWQTGYTLRGGVYVPTSSARATIYPRYMDWTVTVPLLTAELLAVCTVAGAKARSLRFSTMVAAFAMIMFGFLGSQVFDQGASRFWLFVWGGVSTAFYLYLYVALIGAVRTSVQELSPEAGTSLRNAATVLLSIFGAYPLLYTIPIFAHVTPNWMTVMQLAFSASDVLAKVGFGLLIHKVAKLRTAEDVQAGIDTHLESIWISNVHKSEGVAPQVARVSSDVLAQFRGNTVIDTPQHVGHGREGASSARSTGATAGSSGSGDSRG